MIGLSQRQTSKGAQRAGTPEVSDSPHARHGSPQSRASTAQPLPQPPPPSQPPSHSHTTNWQTTAAVVSNPYPQPPQPTPLQGDPSVKAFSKRISLAAEGSCPGNGECNGLGGKTCCNGCPALNNRLLYSHRANKDGGGDDQREQPSRSDEIKLGAVDDGEGNAGSGATSADGGMECVNCGTSKSSGRR